MSSENVVTVLYDRRRVDCLGHFEQVDVPLMRSAKSNSGIFVRNIYLACQENNTLHSQYYPTTLSSHNIHMSLRIASLRKCQKFEMNFATEFLPLWSYVLPISDIAVYYHYDMVQGESFGRVRVLMPEHEFAHAQLNVSNSIFSNKKGLKILLVGAVN